MCSSFAQCRMTSNMVSALESPGGRKWATKMCLWAPAAFLQRGGQCKRRHVLIHRKEKHVCFWR